LGVLFPYFRNNYDFFTFKKKIKSIIIFVILVIIIPFEKKNWLVKTANDNQLFSN